MSRWAWLLLLALAAPAQAEGTLAQCREISDGTERLACYDALPGPAASAEPAPSAADFGRPKPPPREPDSIQSRIRGAFTGWKKGNLVELDNGQVWRIVADDEGYYPNAPDNSPVSISKSWAGAYWMDVESIGRRIKVRRVR